MSIKAARLDLKLSTAASPRKRRHESARKKTSKGVATVIEPESEKGVQLEKPRFAESAWKLSLQSMSTGLAL